MVNEHFYENWMNKPFDVLEEELKEQLSPKTYDVPMPVDDSYGTYRKMLDILMNHCGETGENEGAVETLERIIKERDEYKLELTKLAFESYCWKEMQKENFKFSSKWASIAGSGKIVLNVLQNELKDGEKSFEQVLERIIKERDDLQKKWDELPDRYKDGLPDWFDAAH